MGKISRWLLVIFAAFLVAGAGLAGWRQFSKPTVLKIAVGPADSEDAGLVSAFARSLSGKASDIRISIEPTSGPVESVRKLMAGEVQLAVARADGVPSDRIRSIAILHTDPVVIAAPDQPKLADLGALKDKTLGVVGPPAVNDALVATLQKHYSLTGPVKAVRPDPAAVASAIKDKTVQALLFVAPTTRSAEIGRSWAAIKNAAGRRLSLIPIDSAAAIAAANSAYEAGEIPAGQFGGSPPLPAEDTTTVDVATYLVADRNVRDVVATSLTRALFEERQHMVADAPVAALIKAASTDKDANIPIHPGAKAFYDGEETTFMERYGDMVYYVPVIFGAIGSLVVALRRFLFGSENTQLPLSEQVSMLLSKIRNADSISDLDESQSDLDTLVMNLTSANGPPDVDNPTTAALAISYLSAVIADRRTFITARK